MIFEDIIARYVAMHSDDVMDLIGFSERPGGDGKYLILQRSHEFDEQDRALGMDKIHVQISDESRSCYGGISEIAVSHDDICFSFDEKAATVLGLNGPLHVNVDEALLSSTGVIDFMRKICDPDGIRISGK